MQYITEPAPQATEQDRYCNPQPGRHTKKTLNQLSQNHRPPVILLSGKVHESCFAWQHARCTPSTQPGELQVEPRSINPLCATLTSSNGETTSADGRSEQERRITRNVHRAPQSTRQSVASVKITSECRVACRILHRGNSEQTDHQKDRNQSTSQLQSHTSPHSTCQCQAAANTRHTMLC